MSKTKNTTSVPKKTRVLNYLEKGKSITKNQALSMFKLKNLRATVSSLRQDGYKITPVTTNTGTKYSLAR